MHFAKTHAYASKDLYQRIYRSALKFVTTSLLPINGRPGAKNATAPGDKSRP